MPDNSLLHIDALSIIEAAPDPYLILLPNHPVYTVVGVTNAYLQSTHTIKSRLVGKSVEYIFAPADVNRSAPATAGLLASLKHVLQTKQPARAEGQMPDLTDSSVPGNILAFVCTPVLDGVGEVAYIICRLEHKTYNAQHAQPVDLSAPLGSLTTSLNEAEGKGNTADSTDKQQAQEEFKRNLELLKATIDSSPEMIQVLEAVRNEQGAIVDFRYVLLNKEAEKLMGNAVGGSLLQRQPGVVEAGIFNAFRPVVETGVPQQYEQHYVHEQCNNWYYHSVVKLADGVATTISDITERKKSEAEMLRLKDELKQHAAEKYQALFNAIDDGFCIIEVILDDSGKPVDFIYQETNPSFVKHVGLELRGKRRSELFLDKKDFVLEKYAHLLKTGEPLNYEYNVEALGNQWFQMTASRIGAAGSRHLGVVFRNITERKQREQQKEFLLQLNDALRPLADPIAVQRAAAKMIGEYLGVDRAYYCDIEPDGEHWVVADNYVRPGVPPHISSGRIDDFGWAGEQLHAGRMLLISDVTTDPNLSESARAEFQAANIVAALCIPLLKDGRWLANIALQFQSPHEWSDAEIELAQETAERTWAAVERAKAEAALRESEEKYRTLFESINQGFCISEAILDATGKVVDYFQLEVNPAVLQITGLNGQGKLVSEIVPNVEPHWLEPYDQVLRTGEPLLIESYNEYTGKWYQASYSRIGGPGSRLVSVLFDDITERKQQELHQAFLLRFSDELRKETTADTITNRALQMLYEHLGLDRCYVGVYQFAGNRADLTHQVGNDRVQPMPESIRLSDFPEALKITFDGTLVIDDVLNKKGLTETGKQNMAAFGFGALVAASLRKAQDNPQWVMVAVSATPKRWTYNEIRLIEEVTERTWAAIERAKAEQAVHESEEKYRTLFDSMDNGVSTLELIFDENERVVDYILVELNAALTKQTGLTSDIIGKRVSEVTPGLETYWLETFERVVKTGVPERNEYYIAALNSWFDIYTTRVANSNNRKVVTIYNNITERKRREQQQAFLLNLSDTLRTLSGGKTIKNTSLRLISEFFGLDRSYIATVNRSEDLAVITDEYNPNGLPSLVGDYRLSDFPESIRQIEEGTLVIENADTDAALSTLDKASFTAIKLAAVVSSCLRKGERNVIWSFAPASSTPRTWADDEVKLIEEVTERTWAAVERAKAEEALRESEEKYRTLFEVMGQGYAELELLRDADGRVVDQFYLSLNPSFERIFGIPVEQVMGRRRSETFPGLEPWWEDVFDRVARSGVPEQVEYETPSIGGWYEMWVYPRGGDRVTVLYENITERKRRESNLAFLASLISDFAPLGTVAEVMDLAGRRLVEHLRLSHCFFVEVDQEAGECTVLYHFLPGEGQKITGTYPLAAFHTEEDNQVLASGQSMVVNNVEDGIRAPEQAAAYKALDIGAVLNTPHIDRGRWVFDVGIGRSHPGAWQRDEIELMQEVSSRIWIRMQRARAEEALLQSEERLQKALSIETVGVIYFDLEGGIHDCNAAFERMSGFSKEDFAAGRVRWTELTPPEFMEVTLKSKEELYTAGKNTPYEKQYIRPDGSRWWGLFAGKRLSQRECVEFVVNITERKEAEEALSRSEDRFRTLSDAIPQVVWTNDAAGYANYFNQRWYAFTGLSQEQSEGLGWQAVVHPDDALASEEKWKRALATGHLFDTEYRLRGHDGRYRWFIGRTVPLRDHTGQVTGWFGSATDIEDLKQFQDALSQSEARLRVTMESASDYAIITMDTERKVERWSQGAEAIFGYSAEEMTGRSGDLIFTEEDLAAGAPQQEMETARDTGRAADERWHLRKDGSRFFASGVMRPIQNKGLTGYVKVLRDVTEQMKAQEGMRILEERYRIALQSASMAAWDWNIATDEVTWNDQHFYLFGLTPTNHTLDSAFFLQFIHEADREGVATALQKAVHDAGLFNAEFRIARADTGAVRWMTGYGRVVNKTEKGASRMVGVMYDSTDQRQFTEELSRLVTERTAQLQRSNEDLRQFAHVASHDLKEPVRKIQTFNNRILDEYGAELPRKVQTYSEKIGNAAGRMVDMIEGVLRYSKLGNEQNAVQSINLTETIGQIEADLEVLIQQKAAMISTETLPEITANPTLIYQLFYNLVLNALKFSKADVPPRISLVGQRVEKEGKAFEQVIVSDNGIGFEPEFSQEIFKTFTRLHPLEDYEGTGLGLALCKKIVERHGGTITASGVPDVGASFTILLPV